jgi:hypothetical protein
MVARLPWGGLNPRTWVDGHVWRCHGSAPVALHIVLELNDEASGLLVEQHALAPSSGAVPLLQAPD